MNNNTDTKPLYLKLNEERTKGVLKALDNGNLDIQTTGDNTHAIYPNKSFGTINHFSYPSSEAQANAQYVAMAVNNFHILAEALERVNNFIDQQNLDYESSMVKQVKEALNRIS